MQFKTLQCNLDPVIGKYISKYDSDKTDLIMYRVTFKITLWWYKNLTPPNLEQIAKFSTTFIYHLPFTLALHSNLSLGSSSPFLSPVFPASHSFHNLFVPPHPHILAFYRSKEHFIMALFWFDSNDVVLFCS